MARLVRAFFSPRSPLRSSSRPHAVPSFLSTLADPALRIALGVEYDGTDFLGWQRLTHGDTVQGALEQALSRVAAQPVAVTCAGRTDAGVHGRGQVVHFDTEVERDMRGWVLGACSNLPTSVAVLWAQPVPETYHARFAARSRRYRYSIRSEERRVGKEGRARGAPVHL